MVTTRNGSHSNGSGEDAVDLRDIVASEVREAFQSMLPGLFEQMKTEVMQAVDARLAASRGTTGTGGGATRVCTIRDFAACSPAIYDGSKDPARSSRWIFSIEGAFRTCSCPEESKVIFAVNYLRGAAKDWWELTMKDMTENELATYTWAQFTEEFRRQFVPRVEIERITREWLDLSQTTESVNEITSKFNELALFCGDYAKTEEMKMTRYSQMLRTDIREFVVMTKHETLRQMVEAARARELELETQQRLKRKNAAPATGQPEKRFKPSGGRNDGKKSYPKCNRCGKNHEGQCRKLICYKCGKPGHVTKDCKEAARICFGCNQMGHIKSECPNAATGSGVRAPATATLRLTDGAAKKPEVPKARGRAFQLTAEEAVADPDVVTGIYFTA